ncbi:MAG: hypothetical protein CM15mP102_15160 [Flavobacteriales bacterium]|nr:MAG: hypothetical protein CM15mP102_15160 [Flavobacteriales bacterium]
MAKTDSNILYTVIEAEKMKIKDYIRALMEENLGNKLIMTLESQCDHFTFLGL